jgi:hypothetical protein
MTSKLTTDQVRGLIELGRDMQKEIELTLGEDAEVIFADIISELERRLPPRRNH